MVRRLERKIDERLRSTVNRIRQVDEFREDEVLYVGHQVHWPTYDKRRFVLQGRFNSFSYLIENMVARDGVEPPTPAFSGLRSTT